VIREMTRLNNLHGGVNLAQGFPDFPAPPELIAIEARGARLMTVRGELRQQSVGRIERQRKPGPASLSNMTSPHFAGAQRGLLAAAGWEVVKCTVTVMRVMGNGNDALTRAQD